MKIKKRNHSEIIFSKMQFKDVQAVSGVISILYTLTISGSAFKSLRVTFVDCYVSPGLGLKELQKSSIGQTEILVYTLLRKLENKTGNVSGKAKKVKDFSSLKQKQNGNTKN